MKNLLNIMGLMAGIVWLSSCATADVQSDYNKSVNFEKYQTYQLASRDQINPNGHEEFNMEEFADKRLREALIDQMKREGYQRDSVNPDVRVYYDVTIEEKKGYDYAGGYYGGYGYPYGYGYGFGPVGYMPGRAVPYHYSEGTVVVSLVDLEREEVVWHAAYTKTANKAAKLQDRKDMRKAIKEIFEEYPENLREEQ
jgi:hypothetical protein